MKKNDLLEFEKWLIQEDYSDLTIKSYLPKVSYFLEYFKKYHPAIYSDIEKVL